MGNASIFAGSDVKILKDNLNFNGKSKIISVNGNPSSGSGVAATAGTVGIDYTTGKLYRKIDSVNAWAWSELGGTNTSINYYANPDTGPIGWTSYNDGAAAPVDGAGGSSTGITFNRSTAGLLRGTSEILLDKSGFNNSLGSGRAYDFTIDKADVGKTLEISFDFSTSVGYADGNLTVWIIQDPTGTPIVIQPTTYKIPKISTDMASRFVGTFQTQGGASAIRNYRLCLHVSTSSFALWDATIDNIRIGPQTFVYGAPVTDWQIYTPTITGTATNPTLGTNTTRAYWRRVGDSIEITYNLVQTSAGTAGSGTYLISLPSGLSIDTTKIITASSAGIGAGQTVIGSSQLSTTAASNTTSAVVGVVSAYNATNLIVETYSSSVGTQIMSSWGSGSYQLSNTTLYASFDAKVPILGWSSSVQMSNDTDTRVVAARAGGNAAGQSLTANVTNLIFATVQSDTHGAYNSGTGIFTAPVSGFYKIAGCTRLSASVLHSWTIYIDGVAAVNASPYVTTAYNSLSGGVFLNAGQQLSIRCDTNVTVAASTLAQSLSLYIARESGPSAIAASETVAAKYRASAGQSIPNAAVTLVNWDTKDFDSHGAVTTGASWKFTAPIAGKYKISGYVSLVAVAVSQSNRLAVNLYKNGSINITTGFRRFDGTYTANMETVFNGEINLLAGDYIDIRFDSGMPTTTMSTGADVNWVAIERIGN